MIFMRNKNNHVIYAKTLREEQNSQWKFLISAIWKCRQDLTWTAEAITRQAKIRAASLAAIVRPRHRKTETEEQKKRDVNHNTARMAEMWVFRKV